MRDNKTLVERRKHPRVNKALSLKLSSLNADLVTETKNISASGVLCEVEHPLELFTKVKITLLLPIRDSVAVKTKVVRVACEGVVVRKDFIPEIQKFNIAIFFNRISKVASEKLARYISCHTGI
jgi:c-di-GMP-binding flagellar brake protein YcgR